MLYGTDMKRTIVIYFVIGVLLLFLPVLVFAVDPNPPGELRVDVVASANYDYIDKWTHTSPETAIHIKPIKYVIPNQTFYVAILVSGYGVDDKGKPDLSGGFVLQNPDGTLMFDEKNVFKLLYAKSYPKHSFIIMDPAIDLVLEQKDQEGMYVFKGIITDKVLNKTAIGEYRVTLQKNEGGQVSLPNSPKDLDNLWAEFLATGKEEPVKKIIGVLSYPDKGENIVLIGAAEWSLAANAKQHKEVREIIEKESRSATGELKNKLDNILKKI